MLALFNKVIREAPKYEPELNGLIGFPVNAILGRYVVPRVIQCVLTGT